MSKRMIRIKPGQIFEQLSSREGLVLSVVLANGQTFIGALSVLDHNSLTVTDTREHSHKILFSGVYEVIYDFVSR